MKAWPKDAVMIIAAKRGEEITEQMESAIYVTCRECGISLAADSKTIRRAEQLPFLRNGRPIDFFCVECAMLHDRNQIDLMLDDRPGRPAERCPAAYGATHTSRLLQRALAAHDLAEDSGIPRRECETIIDAVVQRTTLEERHEAARQMEADDESDDRDQT